MADYTAAIGTGTIMIRDTGGNVEFWIAAGNSTAWDYDLKWSGVINGRGVGGTFRYNSGAGWQRVFVEYVGSSQSVSFTKTENSGSSGLGGPATVSAWLGRATVPPAPSNIGLDQITHTGMRYRFSGNGDGGSGIIRWEYQCATISSFAGTGVGTSSGTTIRSDLVPGVTHYWHARGVNALGAGGWSATISASTLPPVWVKVGGAWKKAIPYVKVAGVWKAAVAYLKVAGVWKITT